MNIKGDLIVLCVSLPTIVAKKCSNKVCNIKIGKVQSSLSFSLNSEKDEIKKKMCLIINVRHLNERQ